MRAACVSIEIVSDEEVKDRDEERKKAHGDEIVRLDLVRLEEPLARFDDEVGGGDEEQNGLAEAQDIVDVEKPEASSDQLLPEAQVKGQEAE